MLNKDNDFMPCWNSALIVTILSLIIQKYTCMQLCNCKKQGNGSAQKTLCSVLQFSMALGYFYKIGNRLICWKVACLKILHNSRMKFRNEYSSLNSTWKWFHFSKWHRVIVLARGVSGCLLDTVFYLSFTCKYIVSEQFGHPVLKFPSNLDTLFLNPG